jgi:AcrR family transcriptional regulator
MKKKMKEEIKDSVKEKIINSAIEIISADGIQEMTTRKVANMSGVNIAAINYYFGTKEKLALEAVNSLFNGKIPELFSIIDNPEYTTEEKLYYFFKSYINVLSKHPGVLKTIISSLLSGQSEFMDKIFFVKNFFAKIASLVSEQTGIDDMKVISIKLMHTMSAILFPMAMYNYYPIILDNLKISDKETQDLYIEMLLKNNFNVDTEKFSGKNRKGE